MRKRLVAPTAKDLILKMGINEGKPRIQYDSSLAMQREMLELYDVSTDSERNQYVAIRKAI